MTSNIYTVSFYLISLFLFFNFSSPLIFWVFTELNLILFISYMNLNGSEFKQEMNDILLFYFIIQSFSSMLLLSDFFYSSNISVFHNDTIFILTMLLKLGIFPFFFWIFKVSGFLSVHSFVMLMSLQKVPFLMAIFSVLDSTVLFLLIFSFISGGFLMLLCKDLKSMIICSSISYSFWIIFVYFYSVPLFLFFNLLYAVYLWLMFDSYQDGKGSFGYILSFSSFMFFLGLSPFSLFFFKFLTTSFIFGFMGYLELVSFWVFSFLLLFGYMKFFHKFFFSASSSLYSCIKFWKNKMSFYFFTPMFFLLFLL